MQLGNYYNTKTVKLSDSYVVYIHNLRQRTNNNKRNRAANTDVWDPYGNIGDEFNTIQNEGTKYADDKMVELETCIDVKLPSYKYNVESHNFGNLTYKAILPNYKAKPTITLTLAETSDYKIEALLKLIIRRNIKHGGANDMQYIDNGWVDFIVVDVLSNDLHKPVVRYEFSLCRLVDYNLFDLSYDDDSLPTYTMTFTFETYKKIYNPTRESMYESLRETRNTIEQFNTVANKDVEGINNTTQQFNTIKNKT